MQLAYTEYLEGKRHHEVEEATEQRKVDETTRHNVVSEKLSEAQMNLEKYRAELDAQVKREGYANALTLQKLKGELEVALQNAKNTLEYKKLKQAKEQFDKNYKLAIHTQKTVDQKTDSEIAKNNATAYGSIKGVVAQFIEPASTSAKSWYAANRAAVNKALKQGTYQNFVEAYNAWLAGKNTIGGKSVTNRTTYTSVNR
jgi:hypothetical protein